ncbi:TrmB family transcriptional regulator [Halobaculum halobium]|uniref:TrmB family transcriptional regulator n=1 Tax=Halobaculum halobium TaxID=3032281 RepID=A0ABD5T9N5_9EURY|nr:helix-turn-helix domain-containing protein [Halobaculum sp. SYNS20]
MDTDPDPVDDPRGAAIEQLEEFGLSAYAARTFVALVSLGTGTAKEVSQVSEVPRTRVYDAIDELHARGLVDVQQSSPKEFWAISADTTSRKFEREMEYRTSVLRTSLDRLNPAPRSEEQRGVWTVDGQTAVTDRVLEFVSGADDKIVYMTVEELLTEEIIDALCAAAERGVTISLGGVSADVRDRIRDEIPGADIFESLWVWSDTPAGRLLMVDDAQTLVSVLVPDSTSGEAGERAETAIWGAGETNSLVVVLRAIFTWRLQNAEDAAE